MEAAVELKSKGNAAFSSGDEEGAVAAYTRGIEALDAIEKSQSSNGGGGGGAVELRCTILCNRAACFLKQRKYSACVADCDEALALDGGRVKALYRRAKARAELGEIEDAFRDATRCARLGSIDAQALARDLKVRVSEALEKKGAFESPVAQLATKIAEARVVEDDSWRAACGLSAGDSDAAKTMWRRGAVERAMRETKNPLAVRLVGACCAAASEAPQLEGLRELLRARGPDLARLDDSVVPTLAVASRLAEDIEEEDDDSSSKTTIVADVAAVALLESRRSGVRDGAMDVLVKLFSPSDKAENYLEKTKKKKKLGPLAAMMEKESDRERRNRERAAQEAKRRRLASRLSDACLDEEKGAWCRGLWRLLDSEDDNERRKAQAVVARMMRAVAVPAALDKTYELEWEATAVDECGPKDLVSRFDDENVDDVVDAKDLARRRRLASLVSAAHLASSHFGARALELLFDHPAADLLRLVEAKDEIAAAVAADALSAAASSDEGRALLEPLVSAGALEGLMESPALPKAARSAAATAVAKLGLAAKALKAGASETGRLLDASVALLREASADGSSDAVERAIEVLAAMCGNSHVKEELAHGSGRVAGNALDSLCKLETRGSDPAAFGLATIFAAITVTNNELRQRHFREKEMDITPEQYDELQRITKQKAEDDADKDDDDLCKKRCRKLALADGVAALARLASTNPSSATAACLAETLSNLAKDDALRGTLVQQGGFKAAVSLAADDAHPDACRVNAAHAAAKVLVTTNPNMLTDPQRLSAIRPLVWLCRQFKALELAHFEAAMALTNLASLGETAKRRVAKEKGIPALEYLQFSSNEMVQRAATEALCNMVPDEDFLAHLKKPQKLKLWFAFSLEYDRDLPLARAAIGCMAMASACEGMPKDMAACENCFSALAEHLKHHREHPDLLHRAAYCVANLARDLDSRPPLLATNIPALVRTAATTLIDVDNYALLDTLADAVDALKRQPPPRDDDDDDDDATRAAAAERA
ncbi:hypothetical protein CTAYLR_002084 [Chrysophaeum taylorii]|uniref:Protein unc-45 homolog B n=1 Tax=Chrysophaeum taylorii TaxID=2483200 RepID=A0AAD7XTW2_9STRA|nr:hypothetical protein CTAYLR_002084 [Chrysophaeum taylorii]